MSTSAPRRLPGRGPLDSKLWIIHECPTRDEILADVPFSSGGAKALREKMAKYNVSIDMVRQEYLYPYELPPKTSFESAEMDPVLCHHIMQASLELKQAILREKPNCVLLLGSTPLKYLADKVARGDIVSDFRGHVEWSRSLDTKLLPTYSPMHALRQRYVAKKQKPGQYEVLFQTDIGKALSESKTRTYAPTLCDVVVTMDYGQAVRELEDMWKGPYLSFDIETSELAMVCIGLSRSPYRGVTIPLIRTTYHEGKLVQHWPDPEQRLDIYWRIKKLLESTIPKVAQNSQFDMAVLQKVYGIRVQNLVHDTMVAAHNTWCDLPKDLGTLMSIYTAYPYHKDLFGGNLHTFWEYCAKDAITTGAIAIKQIEEMTALGVRQHYLRMTNALIPVLVDMQVTGMRVDVEARDRVIRHLTQFTHALRQAISKLVGIEDFNPGSWQQKSRILYDALKLAPIYHKGKKTTNADALEEIAETHPGVVALFCRAMIRYMEAAHLCGVLETPLDNGRMCTAYDAGGTDTGRLASRESIFGTGTNLQNLQKGWPRRMLVAG